MANTMYLPTDPSSLAVTRILFGLLMMVDVVQERGGSQIHLIWGDPHDCHFPLFSSWTPPPLYVITIMYGILWLAALGIAIGFLFKISCAIFIAIYWYILLLDKTFWNNHSYLFGLLAILLLGSSANSCWSIDAMRNQTKDVRAVPYWNYLAIKFQLFVLYFIAGLKKADKEWLSGYAMTNLGHHWVFDMFKIVLTVEQIDYLIIHLTGFLIDLSSGFLLIFSKTRLLGLLINSSFHIMNTRIFEIGMFPYVCLATLPIFCREDWPRFLFHRNSSPKELTIVKPNIQKRKLTMLFLALYCVMQIFLPYSHFITKGYNNWTNGLYGYSWDMMMYSWDTVLIVVRVNDHETNTEYFIDPTAWTLNDKWSKHGDMHIQYAQCLRKNIAQINDELRKPTNISVFVDVWCSMNGRFQQRMFDPNYELLSSDWTPWKPVSWLKPILSDNIDYRARMVSLKDDVYTWSNDSDVLFVADFPGLNFDNYISPDLKNVTLTVLDGAVYFETESQLQGVHLKVGQSTNVTAGEFHRTTTVSATPARFMYTYVNGSDSGHAAGGLGTEAENENSAASYSTSGTPFPIFEDAVGSYAHFSNFLALLYHAAVEAMYGIPMPRHDQLRMG